MHKRILTTILIICLLSAGFAYAAAPADLYIYSYNGDKDSVEYYIDFAWRYLADDSFCNTSSDPWKYNIPLHMGKLTSGDEEFYVYCCDFRTDIELGTDYRRLNLEDSTYFTANEAAHIRGIMQYGYWYDWTDEDVAAAGAAAGITNLTREEAVAGTQLAIWNYANIEPDRYIHFLDRGATVEEGLNPKVEAFRDYLLTKTALPATPNNTIFTNESVSTALAFTEREDGEIAYNVTVKFKLVSTVPGDLTLTATLGSDTQVFDLDTFLPDEDGYYSITFNNATDTEIELMVTGTQTVNDVYFYEPLVEEVSTACEEDEIVPTPPTVREKSQNLVGWAQGDTPVFAYSSVEFSYGNKNVSLVKYAEGTEIPLAGATFNLYAKQGLNYILVKSNLITNAEGTISVFGLADEYEYYFKEITAPAGYEISPEYYIAEEKTIVFDSPAPPEVPPYTPPTFHSITKTVNKIWNDVGNETNRPEKIEVQLYKDGEPYRESITLNAENNWAYTWYGLPPYNQYSVVELTELENYITTVEDFTITNTYMEEPPETPIPPEPPAEESDTPESAEVPKTGDDLYTWLGLILFTIGCGVLIIKKKEM